MNATRRRVKALSALLVAGVLAAPAARAEAPAGFSMTCVADTIRANEDGAWLLEVRFRNLGSSGIYGDSLLLRITPRATGAVAPPARLVRLTLPVEATNVSAGDSVLARIAVGASAASAVLELDYHGHGWQGGPFRIPARVVADGSVYDGRYPSTIVRAGGRDVEMVKVPAALDAPTAVAGAGVLLLPGEDSDARDMLVTASRLAREGVAVVIVNAPGRGRSQGPDDLAGPASRAAALAALDTLRAMPGVDTERLGAWGCSRGGTLAILLAAGQPKAFRAVAAQGASYDLRTEHATAAAARRSAIEAAAGRDSAQWRARSPLAFASALQPAVLVHHGERDDVFPASGAQVFAAAMKAAGHEVVARITPGAAHALPPAEPMRFLRNQLTPAP